MNENLEKLKQENGISAGNLSESITFKVFTARFAEVGKSWPKYVFTIPMNRLYLVSEGSAVVEFDGIKLSLEKERMYLIPANCRIKASCSRRFCHYYIHFCAHITGSIDLSELFTLGFEHTPSNPPFVTELFTRCLDSYKNHDIQSEMILQSAVKMILSFFIKGMATRDKMRQKLGLIAEYIETHLDTELSNKQLSSAAGLNSVYFANIFSKTYGIPPRQFILNKRIERAAMLLLTTKMKISEIALRTGSKDEMYFSRVFKSRIGKTPFAYRKDGTKCSQGQI